MVGGIEKVNRHISSSHLKSLFRIWDCMFSFCLEEKLRIHYTVQIHSSVLARNTTLLWCLIPHLYREVAGALATTLSKALGSGGFCVKQCDGPTVFILVSWLTPQSCTFLFHTTVLCHLARTEAELLDVSPAWWQRIHLHLCVPGHSSNNSKSHSPAFASACPEVLFWSLCLTSPCCFYHCFCVSQV